ncbi:hypothetical protein CLV53_1294 [Sediminibacterium magnilacihabitans]|nr:hypothetical protein CLV53_1294 [Sediminibacterium magnilacihabitans]
MMLGKIYQKYVVRFGDMRATLSGPLAERGYLLIHNYFDTDDLKRFPEVSASFIDSQESKDIIKKFPFLAKPLFDPNIISIIRDYLGSKAVLDYASGRRFLASGSKSDSWHHDSVGHRIKIFMCITDQDESTHTQVIPNTHLIKYTDYQNSRLNTSDIESRHEPHKVIGAKNDLIIFDTNMMHKGVYSNVPREIVQFEFSDIRKSMLKGHVGIRQSVFDESVVASPLVSKKHLIFQKGSVRFV